MSASPVTEADGELDAAALSRIQNDLFDLGADFCRPDMEKDAEADYPPLRIVPHAQIDRLEAEIDAMNETLEPLRSFILPGGSASGGASACVPHRVAPRRALAVELTNMEPVKRGRQSNTSTA